VIPSTVAPTATPSVAPLPAGLAARIYPADSVDPSQVTSNYTLVSILFDQALNWPFVANNTQSSLELFAWMPTIISTSLNISISDVLTFALQVWQPTSYTSTADADQLGTLWLGYVPHGQVNLLAEQIMNKDSAFYTGTPPPYSTLAAHVDPAFNVESVSPSSTSSNGGSSPDSASTTSASSDSKTREDAIIGVVSSLGAITLIVLAFLVVRAVKQRRELAHRRLSEVSAGYDGSPPDNHEFDRDSLGGQRRRSFYFAADSLRGFSDQGQGGAAETYTTNVSPENAMRERRPVMPGMISTPILRDNTMNW